MNVLDVLIYMAEISTKKYVMDLEIRYRSQLAYEPDLQLEFIEKK